MAYKILIVDDNDNNRYTMKTVLEELNVEIVEAATGSKTLEYLLKNKCDLIILDIQLPDYTGFEIARMIKSKKSTMAIPIIFATAIFKSDQFIVDGYELGAVDYILKPFKAEVLLSKVRFYKSVADERNVLIDALEQKNRTLESHNEQLLRVKHLLTETIDNWKLIGNNIPLNVEVYDVDFNRIFRNNYLENKYNDILHQKHGEKIKALVATSFKRLSSLKEILTLEIGDEKMHFELRTVVIKHERQSHVMLLIHDVSYEKKYIDGVEYIGYHDQLTGLWNRHYFMEYVNKMSIRESIPLTVMMADVNGLKLINDGFGHTAGDELIKAAAKCLKKYTPEETVIARWGGDEFLLLIQNSSKIKAREISKRVVEEIEKERIADKFPVSMAIGSVTSEDYNFDLEMLIKDAEDKMYINKMQNRSSYRSFIVESLKGALFEQDYETIEHTERIGKMALMISEHLDLSRNERDKLILLGSLHDIGKIGISKSILNQKSALSTIDWNIIRRHPEIGYRICIGVPELSSIADYVLSHHERWDGTGYPRMLKGVEIPLLARLISILDAYDVITHDRPYKKAMSPEWAMEEIRKGSGSQFDPNLVNVFEHVYMEMVEAGESFED